MIMKIAFLSLALVYGGSVIAQQAPIVSNASLQSVTVFSVGAELNHTSRITVPTGSSEVVINNVANLLDENSIQIGGSGQVTIMSVSFAKNYLSDQPNSPAYVKLSDSLKAAQRQLQRIADEKATENKLLELLDKNSAIGGANSGVNVAELGKMAEYYRTKQIDTRANLAQLTEKEQEQAKKINKLQQQLREMAGSGNSTSGQLVLQVMADAATTADMNISYITPSAGWTAFYDLRAENTTRPLSIMYKANVIQYTGVDWKKVKLTLSTGNPSQSGTAPVLSAWFLRFGYPEQTIRNKGAVSQRYQNSIQAMDMAAPELAEAKMAPPISSSVGNYTAQTENQLSATFDIALPYDVASNAKPHSVALKEYAVPARYKYYAVPKVDADAFLLAEITDFEKLNLMPGAANIIFENTYVGKSYIDPSVTTDTLNLGMGRDKKITVKRERVAEESGSKLIGSNKKQTFTYEIRVRNSKKEAIQMLLKDQYPVATDRDMEIELLSSSDAEANKETGVLTWKLNIAPGETRKVRFSYSVKYPKDKVINNL
jgi:uncharacterized protein (TIGR02231 family)